MKDITSFERIGIKKGFEQGIKKGRLEGFRIGSANIVLRVLRNQHGSLDETAEVQVRALPLKQIEALIDALPDLDTPADLHMWLLHRSSLPVTESPAVSGSLELDS